MIKKPIPPVVVPSSPSTNHHLTIGLIAVVIVLLICHTWVAAAGLNFYTWGDHLMGGAAKSPIGVWVLGGIFAGGAAGAVVMSLKYQLRRSFWIVPVAGFVLLITLMASLAEPMSILQPVQVTVVPAGDTARAKAVSQPVQRYRRHHQTAVLTDTSVAPFVDEQPKAAVADILTEQAEISIHARTDSVWLHYRTRATHAGAWSDWQEKFIPSAGQSLLTSDELVKAHALEWWYEVGGTSTRSAASPFRKDHCDGVLVIDTY
ncbi:MAG: hypothetical protein V4592_08115 [Bacteroidota bacterium]